MQGRRLPDATTPRELGEYAWLPYAGWAHKPSFFTGEGEWMMIDPTGRAGAIGRATREKPAAAHTWVEHEDGSVTFAPSLVMPSGWHGYLERGVWREV